MPEILVDNNVENITESEVIKKDICNYRETLGNQTHTKEPET